jgi:hypothetical protein
MSYLDIARLHFAGSFKASPSTVNNDPNNYNPARIISRGDKAWNPNGNHTFAINAEIKSTCLAGGSPSTTDALVGSPVVSTDAPTFAKLVDLDTEQQILPVTRDLSRDKLAVILKWMDNGLPEGPRP